MNSKGYPTSVFRYYAVLILFPAILMLSCFRSAAQVITCKPLLSPEGKECGVYEVRIRNTSADSIMVLHTQEVALPPFINHYKWDRDGQSREAILYFGKSDNPYFPEQYRATKTLLPDEELQLFIAQPKMPDTPARRMLINYSMLSGRFKEDFIRLESRPTVANQKRCKALKEKNGVVFKKRVEF